MKQTLILYKYRVLAWIKYKISMQVQGAFFFIRLSWKMLWGKIGIMDTELMDSNVGYKYKAFIITKLPVSKEHTYEDL